MPEESYYIWAAPKGRPGEQLAGEIKHLADKYGCRAFPPHMTVVGEIKGRPREEVLRVARELAARTQKYRVNFTGVSHGSAFYQCVYLTVAPDPPVMAAAAAAREAYGIISTYGTAMTNTTGAQYMPHVSLLYSDMGQDERAAAMQYETGRLYGEGGAAGGVTGLVEGGYDVGSFQVWNTPLDNKAMGSWCMVGEFELCG